MQGQPAGWVTVTGLANWVAGLTSRAGRLALHSRGGKERQKDSGEQLGQVRGMFGGPSITAANRYR